MNAGATNRRDAGDRGRERSGHSTTVVSPGVVIRTIPTDGPTDGSPKSIMEDAP